MESVQRQVQQLKFLCHRATVRRDVVRYVLPLVCVVAWSCTNGKGCVNPFAPQADTSPSESACDPTRTTPAGIPEGVFQCFQAAYTFRDTSVYGQLLAEDFVFIYRDYQLGIDITWGRDDEMRATYGLFRNAQKLDLIWNNIISTARDSMRVNVVRGFNLTITFNPTDIERVDGYANLIFQRTHSTDPWKIVQWRDESNF